MFLCRPAVANLENSLSLKISSHESSNTRRQFSNSEMSSKLENFLKCSVSSLTIGILADHADKNNKLFETLGKNVPTNNILKMSSVFPQQDGPQTAMNNRSLVEITLFITLDLEERIQLYKKEVKTKMWILHSQD